MLVKEYAKGWITVEIPDALLDKYLSDWNPIWRPTRKDFAKTLAEIVSFSRTYWEEKLFDGKWRMAAGFPDVYGSFNAETNTFVVNRIGEVF